MKTKAFLFLLVFSFVVQILQAQKPRIYFNTITFISYLTVQPDRSAVDDYVSQMTEALLDDSTQLWYIGRMVEFINKEIVHENVSTFNSITELVNEL